MHLRLVYKNSCHHVMLNTPKAWTVIDSLFNFAYWCSLRTFQELRKFTPVYADAEHAIALAAVGASYQSMATAMMCVSITGRTAALLSAYRPRCPIVMVTRSETVARQSLLYR